MMRLYNCFLKTALVYAIAVCVSLIVFCPSRLIAQNDLATLSGTVTDQTGALIAHAKVIVVEVSRNEPHRLETNAAGSFTVPGLPPGNYAVRIMAKGFASVNVQDVHVHTAEQRQVLVAMRVGQEQTYVDVRSEREPLSTSSAVSTNIDSAFVQDIPLNGRSIQNLLLVVPGVNQDVNDGGLAVNGNRSDGNYFTVDGVSANAGSLHFNPSLYGAAISTGAVYQALSGSTPTQSSFGGMSGVISIDSLDEFTVQTSTYSAAYGRQPGAQVQLTSKSGSNRFHGSVFDYLRNDAFNAQFSILSTQSSVKQREREQDFGGTLGGPIRKDHTFFFFNYEGVRGIYPDTGGANLSAPTPDIRDDANIPSGLRAILALFPSKNLGPEQVQCNLYDSTYTNCLDSVPAGYAYWQGLGYVGRNSNNYSAKLDHMVNSKLNLAFRYNWNDSNTANNPLVNTDENDINIRNYTLNANYAFDAARLNTLSAAVSRTAGNRASVARPIAGQGGVLPPDTSLVAPLRPNSLYQVLLGSYYTQLQVGNQVADLQRQLNLVDNFTWTTKAHLFIFGADFRYTYPHVEPQPYSFNADFIYPWELDPSLLNQPGYSQWYCQYQQTSGTGTPIVNEQYGNVCPAGAGSDGVVNTTPTPVAYSTYTQEQDPLTLIYKNLSLYAQDTWKATPRLQFDLGVRWEYNPALSSRGGPLDYAAGWEGDYAAIALAPAGTPLYNAPLADFAPRVGFAYTMHPQPGQGTVLRGGLGIFYDTGQQVGGAAAQYYPHSHIHVIGYQGGGGVTADPTDTLRAYPYSSTALLPPTAADSTSYQNFIGQMTNFDLPRTYQWNLALQQALGKAQSVTFSYVGTSGRRLLRTYVQSPDSTPAIILGGASNADLPGATIYGTRNDGQYGDFSNYNALQLNYSRQMAKGLQALVNYTWSHSLDTNTSDYSPVEQQAGETELDLPGDNYGNSDNQHRHVLNAIFTYQPPALKSAFGSSNSFGAKAFKATVNGWAVSGLFRAQSGAAFSVLYQKYLAPYGYPSSNYRASYNGGTIFVNNAQGFGPKLFNSAAFTAPPCAMLSNPFAACNGNTSRNAFPGYAAWSQDLNVRRTFPIRDNIKAEFRAEAFNIFNRPNYGFPQSEIIASYNENGQLVSHFNGNQTNGNSAASAGNGALALPAIYQLGGPRSMQFALKVTF